MLAMDDNQMDDNNKADLQPDSNTQANTAANDPLPIAAQTASMHVLCCQGQHP